MFHSYNKRTTETIDNVSYHIDECDCGCKRFTTEEADGFQFISGYLHNGIVTGNAPKCNRLPKEIQKKYEGWFFNDRMECPTTQKTVGIMTQQKPPNSDFL